MKLFLALATCIFSVAPMHSMATGSFSPTHATQKTDKIPMKVFSQVSILPDSGDALSNVIGFSITQVSALKIGNIRYEHLISNPGISKNTISAPTINHNIMSSFTLNDKGLGASVTKQTMTIANSSGSVTVANKPAVTFEPLVLSVKIPDILRGQKLRMQLKDGDARGAINRANGTITVSKKDIDASSGKSSVKMSVPTASDQIDITFKFVCAIPKNTSSGSSHSIIKDDYDNCTRDSSGGFDTTNGGKEGYKFTPKATNIRSSHAMSDKYRHAAVVFYPNKIAAKDNDINSGRYYGKYTLSFVMD